MLRIYHKLTTVLTPRQALVVGVAFVASLCLALLLAWLFARYNRRRALMRTL